MQEIYKTTTSAMRAYMYPKKTVILNAALAEEEKPAAENDTIELDVAEMGTDSDEAIEEIINPKELRKSELVDYIKSVHGADADVSGTKADIIERYF